MIRTHYRVRPDGRRVRVPFWRARRDAHLVGSLIATETDGKSIY